MGSIIGRTRKDGTTAYLAQILIKRKGKIVHRESETFDRKQAAKAWLARRETELSEPGAFDPKHDVKLSDVIDRYIAETERELGKTKAQVLAKIKECEAMTIIRSMPRVRATNYATLSPPLTL